MKFVTKLKLELIRDVSGEFEFNGAETYECFGVDCNSGIVLHEGTNAKGNIVYVSSICEELSVTWKPCGSIQFNTRNCHVSKEVKNIVKP